MRQPLGKVRLLIALLAAIASSPSSLFGSGAVPIGPCGQPGDRVLSIPVRVMTQRRALINGLKAGNFAIKEKSAPLEVCGVTHDLQSVSVGILMDTSASMRGGTANLPAIARAGINQLLDTSGPQDEYFLEYVNNTANMQCLFSCDRHNLKNRLQVTPKGRTALIDGIYLALHGMSKAHRANRALLIVSDAGENASLYTVKELEGAYADCPVPIFFFVPREPDVRRPTSEEMAAWDSFARLVSDSGGFRVDVFNQREAVNGMAQLAPVMRSPYMVYFACPPSHKILRRDLRVEVKGMHPNPRVFYGSPSEFAGR